MSVFGIIGLLAVAFFALLVVLYVAKGAPVRGLRLLTDREQPPAVDEAEFCEVAEEHLDTVLEAGNRVKLLFNGEETYPRLWDDLRAARRLIVWQVFWFKPGRLADELQEILVERARAGVTILFLRDAYGSWGVPKRWFESLTAAGIEVAQYRPPHLFTLYKLPQRSHARTVVIDGEIGYTGGFAIADEWLGDGRSPGHWRDTSVRFEGPVVRQLAAAFAANWAEATGQLLIGEHLFPPEEHRDGTFAGLVHAAPSLGSTDSERLWMLSIESARQQLYLTTAYFVPEPGMRDALCRAARRGVDVRVLTPGGNSDRLSTWYAGRVHYEELMAAGVRLYEYRPTMVHAKTFVVDDAWIGVGTLNFDNRSMALNDEVVLVCQDPDLAGELRDRFLADIELADEVDCESFASRSRRERFRERRWALISRVL